MALKQFKPRTPGTRQLVLVDKSGLHKGGPVKSLTEGKHSKGGRNNTGRIVVRYQGGGHKQRYRLIDFKRSRFNDPAVVNAIVDGRGTFDALQQQRLLEIAGNAFEIKELASAVAAPKCNADGSPMITTQAAIVLATYRHLASIVKVVDPEQLPGEDLGLARLGIHRHDHETPGPTSGEGLFV